MGRDGEQVAERGWQERGELLFREQLEKGGFEVVDAILEGRQKLHDGGRTDGWMDAIGILVLVFLLLLLLSFSSSSSSSLLL